MSSNYVFYAWTDSDGLLDVFECTDNPRYTLNIEYRGRFLSRSTHVVHVGFRTLAEALIDATDRIADARKERRINDLIRIVITGPKCREKSRILSGWTNSFVVLYGRE
jgi:hypothetical protein